MKASQMTQDTYMKKHQLITLHKEWNFPLRISSVNSLKKSEMENFLGRVVILTKK